jgi:hypothetical protein
MKRVFIFLSILALAAGCTSVSDRAQWEEAMRDLRGDNMQMGSRPTNTSGWSDPPLRSNSRD